MDLFITLWLRPSLWELIKWNRVWWWDVPTPQGSLQNHSTEVKFANKQLFCATELSHVCLQLWLVWTCPHVWHWETAWWRLPIITSEYRDTRPTSSPIMSYLWFLPALDVGSVTHRCRSVGECGRWWQDECIQWADCHGLWSVRFGQKGNRNYLFHRYQSGNPIYLCGWTEKNDESLF